MTFGANRRLRTKPARREWFLGGYFRGRRRPAWHPSTFRTGFLLCQAPSGSNLKSRARSVQPTRV